MTELLLDTGPLVALLDRSERQHARCMEFFRQYRGKLITTEAVLTEAVYLLGPAYSHQKAALDFVTQGGAELVALSPQLVARCSALMGKYADVPMDFADATLVALAEEMKIDKIFTLDKRGFTVYRYLSRKSFSIFPE